LSKKSTNIEATPTTTKTTWHWIFSGILFLIFFATYNYTFDSKLDLGGDNGGYYILGKAISSGQGYTNIHYIGNPPHSHFPPGYPALVAIFMFISDSVIFIKIMNGLLLAGSALLMYRIFFKVTENAKLSFVSSTLILLNMHLLKYSTIMMSEIPFLFFGSLTLLLFLNSSEKKQFYKSPSFYGLIVASSFAYHIRTAGIALIGGIILYLLIKKNWKFLLAYFTGFVALGIPWFLRGKSLGGNKYIDKLFMVNPYRPEEGKMQLGDWFTRFFNNLERYISKEIPHGLFPGVKVDYTPGTAAEMSTWLIGFLIVGLVVFGLIKLKNYRTFFIGYIGGTFAILLLWPDVWFSVRFMLPLIPIILFLMIYALFALLTLAADKMNMSKKISPLILLVMAFFFLPQLKELHAKAKEVYPRKFNNYFEAGKWVNRNTPKTAVISTRKPNLFYLTSNRKLNRFKSTADYNQLLDALKEKQTTHVVLDQMGFSQTFRYLWPVIQGNPRKFTQVHVVSNPETVIYKFNYDAGYHGEWKQTKDENGNLVSVKHGMGVMKDNQGRVVKQGRWDNGTFVQNSQNISND